MKRYVIVDSGAKYCPYISTYYQPGMPDPLPIALDHISKARFWSISELISEDDESKEMLAFFRKYKAQDLGKNWEVREVTFLVGPPLTFVA